MLGWFFWARSSVFWALDWWVPEVFPLLVKWRFLDRLRISRNLKEVFCVGNLLSVRNQKETAQCGKPSQKIVSFFLDPKPHNFPQEDYQFSRQRDKESNCFQACNVRARLTVDSRIYSLIWVRRTISQSQEISGVTYGTVVFFTHTGKYGRHFFI